MVFGKKDKTDEPEVRTVSTGFREGPPHECTSPEHNGELFTTEDSEAWKKHLQSHKSYQQGSAPCAICGNSVNMNEVLTKGGNQPIHPECVPKQEEEL